MSGEAPRSRSPAGPRLVAAAVAAVAAVSAWLVTHRVFPYRSRNHDEGVYLQHAAMLADGRLAMHAGDLAASFRPWFFVVEGGAMYPKYQPVVPALFALADAVTGSYGAALPVVAAGVVALTYGIGVETEDRRVGAVAATAVLASPLFVVQSGLFMSYLPTLALLLAFVYAFLRARRTDSTVWAAVAGLAVAVGFFSRPYGAVLVAAPFVALALAELALALRDARRGSPAATTRLRRHAVRHGATATVGLLGPGAALLYNAVLVGDPLTFPYLAFAPLDGPGFGLRRITSHEVRYGLPTALDANARVLWAYATRWGPAGLVGAALGLVGAVDAVRRRAVPALLLVGVAVAVIAGNLAFWGNLNILGALDDPSDGLIHLFGTMYHVPLLLPATVLGARGLVVLRRTATRAADRRVDSERAARLGLAAAVAVAAVGAGIGVAATADVLGDNRDVTAKYAAAYQPFEERDLAGGLVFLPQTYNAWLNHPFQYLRNAPDLDGDTVYGIGRGAADLAVADAYPERSLHRYVYRGRWDPVDAPAVTPALRDLRVVTGDAVGANTTLELGTRVTGVAVSLRSDATGEAVRRPLGAVADADVPGNASVRWRVANGSARFADADGSIAVADRDVVTMTIDVALRYDGYRFRQRLPVETGANGSRALAPPRTEVCYGAARCGGEAAHVEGDGVRSRTRVRAAPPARP